MKALTEKIEFAKTSSAFENHQNGIDFRSNFLVLSHEKFMQRRSPHSCLPKVTKASLKVCIKSRSELHNAAVVCHGAHQNYGDGCWVMCSLRHSHDTRSSPVFYPSARIEAPAAAAHSLGPSLAAKCSHIRRLSYMCVCAPRLFWFECTGMRAVCFFPKRLSEQDEADRQIDVLQVGRVLLNFASRKQSSGDTPNSLKSAEGSLFIMQIVF